jgi:hypothetical protein
MQGRIDIPTVPVRITVTPIPGDNTQRIQSAVDYVSNLTPDANGFRGAVLLQKGRYELQGGIEIHSSGIILRGSGPDDDGTLLVAAGIDRRTLITIKGQPNQTIEGAPEQISDPYVPVNATKFHIAGAGAFKVGDTIEIHRPTTAEWIKALSMVDLGGGIGLGWKPNTRDIIWNRTITAINKTEITIDVPLTTALDQTYGGATVTKFTWPGRIANVGVENLAMDSFYDEKNPKDESHSWIAVTLENVKDAWVRRIKTTHFVCGAVNVFDTASEVTVENCRSLAPISEIAGYRRHTFYTAGQLTLFKSCWSEQGRHDFSVGCCAAGPNAFVQCEAVDPLDDSGSIDSWASGVLFDNVRIDGNAINLGNRGYQNAFIGWSAANSVLWQCDASLLILPAPPTAQNWAFGCWGEFNGDAQWSASNSSVKPASLYYAQLADRGFHDADRRADLLMQLSDASSSPTVEQAQELISESSHPGPVLASWIDDVNNRFPLTIDSAGAKNINDFSPPGTPLSPSPGNPGEGRGGGGTPGAPQSSVTPPTPPATTLPLTLKNGWLVVDNHLASGGREQVQWWRGGIRPADIRENAPCLTRFVPGRNGIGLTDDLDQLTDSMLDNNVIGMEHHYALWYDERDDDHERVKRMNGDVWPPFYELPFLRSGQGQAWDGLSKYDLTKYNPWYFNRLKQFGQLCDEKGLVLVHQIFFQHNIIEAGAHWASCPWRSANNINDMGFPEPPPYIGDKRIFMAAQWYDMTNKHRCDIYAAYIRHCLDAQSATNVVYLTGDEFTGPLPFVQFWVDTIAQWEKDTGRKVIVGLSTTKDVQDAILADPDRAPIVNVVDIRYWWYQADGTPYAPEGGLSMSPRQLERVIKHRGSSFPQVYRAVNEYKKKYPDKAVMYSADGQSQFGWAALIAGGSLPDIRSPIEPALLAAIPTMHPTEIPGNKSLLALKDDHENYLICTTARGTPQLPATFNDYRKTEIESRGANILWLTKQ